MRKILTCGVFDIIHAGHIRFFKWVRTEYPGYEFTVALNSEISLSMLKRKAIHTYPQRAEILEAIRYIDRVIPMHDTEPTDVIKVEKPNLFVKGADYKVNIDMIPEYHAMNNYTDGKLIICPILELGKGGDKLSSYNIAKTLGGK